MPTITASTWRLAQRFVWKEYRMLRELALGVIGLALAAMLFVQAVSAESVRASAVLLVAIGAAAMTAIAAAVTLFSVETEEGTAELMRILPSQRRGQFFGKVSGGIGTVLAVLAILVAIALALAGPPPNARAYASQGAMVLAEAFVWALLASLLCPNPLVAAVLGIAGASLNSQLAMALTTASSMGYTLQSYQAAIPARLVLVALVGALDVWLGLHWPRPIAVAKSAARTKSITNAQPTRRRWQTEFWRFVWQTVRQSWKTAVGVLVLGVALSGIFALVTTYLFPITSERTFILQSLGFLFAPALLGAVVFREDQRGRQYRFLSEHVGRPYTLWLARQATWITLLAIICGALGLGFWLFWNAQLGRMFVNQYANSWSGQWNYPLEVAGIRLRSDQVQAFIGGGLRLAGCAAFSAYAIGQFYSLLLRSNVLAGMMALVSSVMLAAWMRLVGAWQLTPLWFVAPIGVGAMLASFVVVRAWLFELANWRHWLASFAIRIASVAGVLYFVPTARMLQLEGPVLAKRLEGSGVSLTQRVHSIQTLQEGGRTVADEYARLSAIASEATPANPVSDELIAKYIALSHMDCTLPIEMNITFDRGRELQRLQCAVLRGSSDEYGQEIVSLEKADQIATKPWSPSLEEQLERLLACRRVDLQLARSWPLSAVPNKQLSDQLLKWATHPDQTPELLLKAVRELIKIDERRPGPSTLSILDYLQALAVVRGEFPPGYFSRDDRPKFDKWLDFFLLQLPGERSRAERALEIYLTRQLDYLVDSERVLLAPAETKLQVDDKRQRLVGPVDESVFTLEALRQTYANQGYLLEQSLAQLEQARTTFLAIREAGDLQFLPQYLEQWFSNRARLRAERVRLALLAYRIKNGAYPPMLDDLAPEFMGPEDFRDPYSLSAFGYQPQGFKLRVVSGQNPRSTERNFPAGTPLLWCRGVGDAQPVEQVLVSGVDASGQPIEELTPRDTLDEDDQGEEVISLIPDYWRYGAFWLPLPK